jgi:hypothetical protein
MPRERIEKGNQPERQQRTPLYEQKDKINIKDQDPNYFYRWVDTNNPSDPERVERFQRAGYEFAPGDSQVGDSTLEDKTTRTSVSVERNMGQGLKQVLMRIRRDWYEEDQRAKAERLNDMERAMYSEAKEGRYGSFSGKSSTRWND